jgi:hypothetical protein
MLPTAAHRLHDRALAIPFDHFDTNSVGKTARCLILVAHRGFA